MAQSPSLLLPKLQLQVQQAQPLCAHIQSVLIVPFVRSPLGVLMNKQSLPQQRPSIHNPAANTPLSLPMLGRK